MLKIINQLSLTAASRFPFRPVIQTLGEGIVPVFMLHRIEDPAHGVQGTPIEVIDLFLRKLKKAGYEFMGVDELCLHMEQPGACLKNKVMFTMDDGYRDQVEKGVPVFQSHNCPVSIAVITDFIAGKDWPWDAKIRYMFEHSAIDVFKDPVSGLQASNFQVHKQRNIIMRAVRENLKKEPYDSLSSKLEHYSQLLKVTLPDSVPDQYQACSWEDIKRLEGNGVTFLPHTVNHIILTNLSGQQAKSEISHSIMAINKHINGLPVFVYPNGQRDDFNHSHIDMLKTLDVKMAFSTEKNYLNCYELDRDGHDIFQIPRIAFPEKPVEQDLIISKLDYVYTQFQSRKLKRTVETAYGIKRQMLKHMVRSMFSTYKINTYKKLDVSRINRLVFICAGNICRSPFAEFVSKSRHSSCPVVSMGLDAPNGDNADPVAIKIAKEFGCDMSLHRSTTLKSKILTEGDLLVVMELKHLKRLQPVLEKVGCQATLLGVWDDQPRLVIEDPYGRSDARFRMLFSHIVAGVKNLVKELKK